MGCCKDRESACNDHDLIDVAPRSHTHNVSYNRSIPAHTKLKSCSWCSTWGTVGLEAESWEAVAALMGCCKDRESACSDHDLIDVARRSHTHNVSYNRSIPAHTKLKSCSWCSTWGTVGLEAESWEAVAALMGCCKDRESACSDHDLTDVARRSQPQCIILQGHVISQKAEGLQLM